MEIKYLPQSPFTGQFYLITKFAIAFYQSNLFTFWPVLALHQPSAKFRWKIPNFYQLSADSIRLSSL
jgi:hypothetical protein